MGITLNIGLLLALLATFLRGYRSGAINWTRCSFLASFSVVGLYIFDNFRIPSRIRSAFYSEIDYHYLLALSFLFILSLILGEFIGQKAYASRQRRRDVSVRKTMTADRHEEFHQYLLAAFILLVIGIAAKVIFVQVSGGFASMYGAAHGEGKIFTTAYLYKMPEILFSAFSLFLILRFRYRKYFKFRHSMALFCLLAFLLFDAVVGSSRGDLLRIALALIIPIVTYRSLSMLQKNRLLIVGSLAVMAMVLAPYVRNSVYLGSDLSFVDAVSTADVLSVRDDYSTGHVYLEGKHTIFAANIVGAVVSDPQPNFGFRWVFPIVNLVPRTLWPDKPYRYEWVYDFYDSYSDYSRVPMPSGAYPGGMVTSFSEFWILAPLIWIAMGCLGAIIRSRALSTKNVKDTILFYAFSVAFVQFLLQDFIQGAFTFIYLYPAFLIVNWFVRSLTSKTGYR